MTLSTPAVAAEVTSASAAPPSKPQVLLVDDRPENLLTLESLLAELDVHIVTAGSGNEALGLLLEHDFALVLLDVQMPGMDGFEVAELMRGAERTRAIPIIFVTALSTGQEHQFKGYEAGAVDYLSKPLNPQILRSKVRVFVDLFRLRQELESRNRALDELTRKLRTAALTDPLTGLRNRRHVLETIDKDLAMVKRAYHGVKHDQGEPPANADLGLLLIDVDHFKRINDTHGHDAGDAVLVAISRRLEEAVREADSVVRWGGEEFLVLLRNADRRSLGGVAERLRLAIAAEPVVLPGGGETAVTCSIGYSAYPVTVGRAFRWDDALNVSDAALLLAKRQGRNRCRGVEVCAFGETAEERSGLLEDIEGAIADGRMRSLP